MEFEQLWSIAALFVGPVAGALIGACLGWRRHRKTRQQLADLTERTEVIFELLTPVVNEMQAGSSKQLLSEMVRTTEARHQLMPSGVERTALSPDFYSNIDTAVCSAVGETSPQLADKLRVFVVPFGQKHFDVPFSHAPAGVAPQSPPLTVDRLLEEPRLWGSHGDEEPS